MPEGRGRRPNYESGLFSGIHKPILQAWVDGLQTIDELVEALGKKRERISHLRTDITSIMDVGIGRDRVAKAVSYAVVHNLVNFEVIDKIRPARKFSDREAYVLTAVALGLDNEQIASHLSITGEEVEKGLQDILVNLGVSSPYTALAWGIRRSLQRLKQVS